MKLTPDEVQFLTALAREQNQAGCRGPAHELLRRHAYPEAPRTGPGSLAFAYEAVPLTSLLLDPIADLQEMDDFLRKGERLLEPRWPWASAEDYRARLAEASREWEARRNNSQPSDARSTA
ncbi:MAG: hypothetical protein IT429_06095 [Gemmataceae bacterium]|nr:hypothetical protein [Gemmataceae bacterium]